MNALIWVKSISKLNKYINFDFFKFKFWSKICKFGVLNLALGHFISKTHLLNYVRFKKSLLVISKLKNRFKSKKTDQPSCL